MRRRASATPLSSSVGYMRCAVAVDPVRMVGREWSHCCRLAVEDVQDSLAGTAAATEKLITEHNCTIIFAPCVRQRRGGAVGSSWAACLVAHAAFDPQLRIHLHARSR